MKNIITIVILIIISSISYANVDKNSLEEFKIGLVNPVEVYQTVPQGENTIKNLLSKLKPKADQLQEQQSLLVKKMQELQNNAPTLTDSELNKQKETLHKDQEKFKQKAVAFRQSEMTQEQQVTQSFQNSFNTAIKKIAISEKYSLILSLQAVAYTDPNIKIDITKNIINIMKISAKEDSEEFISKYNQNI
jgi:outer membrane protein